MKLTALTLWDYADQYGREVRPGNKELADVRGVSQRSITTHLAELTAAGWCRKVSDGRVAEKRHYASVYRLTFPDDYVKPEAPMVDVDHAKPEVPMVDADHRKTDADHRNPELLPNRSLLKDPVEEERTDRPISIPCDWKPSQEHQDYAQSRCLDLDAVAAYFKSYVVERSWERKDWDLAFSSWLSREQPKPKGQVGARAGSYGVKTGTYKGRVWQE